MAPERPNLARRPFVDTRPVNVALAVLLLAAIALTAVSVRTVHAYLGGSRKSREAIAALRVEIDRLETSRLAAEQKLSRFDLEGMRVSAEEANALARLRAFSWTRFLTRLEQALPNDVRVNSIALRRPEERPIREAGAARETGAPPPADDSFPVTLSLVSRDPDGLPKLIRAMYASPWFDKPTPTSEQGGEKGSTEGRTLNIDVVYRDVEGKK